MKMSSKGRSVITSPIQQKETEEDIEDRYLATTSDFLQQPQPLAPSQLQLRIEESPIAEQSDSFESQHYNVTQISQK